VSAGAGSIVRCAVRPGAYYDSVVLMQLQRSLGALPGVLDAGVMMATPANRELMAASGLLAPDSTEAYGAEPGDLLIAVRGESAEAAAEALAGVDALLRLRREDRAGSDSGFRPRSLDGALKQLPEARWVLVSVPGRYAAGVASDALDRGRSVFLYSDNVSLADEVALKRKAEGLGLLVMGPDCGTAIVGGAGFGFANRVRRGSIGLVGASGTGLQLVTSLIHERGDGVSQAIGTGGRDLSEAVGGITARLALDLLARDPETETIVLLSKPPSPLVGARLLAAAARAGKPVIVSFLGFAPPLRNIGNLRFASSLAEAAELAVAASASGIGDSASQAPRSLARPPSPSSTFNASDIAGASSAPASTRVGAGPYLRGLFSGGTLAYELQLGLQALIAPLWSNIPTAIVQRLPDPNHSREHAILDLGEDEFTVGRLHPMIDPDLRLRRLRQEAADPEVGLILLDLVLGDGAHADPAGALAPAIERARSDAGSAGHELGVAVLVVGTGDDPQDLGEQVATLERAGAWVCRTTEEMVEEVWRRFAPSSERPAAPVSLEVLGGGAAPQAVNIGLESFYDSLAAQGIPAVHVEWRPPAGGDLRLAGILERLKRA
jgi:FdrA protein